MVGTKKELVEELRKKIDLLQGFKPASGQAIDMGLGPIVNAFPNAVFPIASVHEFISDLPEDTAATGGFIAALLTPLMRSGGACVWISANRTLFPPALKTFGIQPDQILFIDLGRAKEVLWATEEALKCKGLAAVICEVSEMDFVASRRFQLVVEKSGTTGFIIRKRPQTLGATACTARWKITALPSLQPEDGPGLGFYCWQVELLKVTNGRPGCWTIQWQENGLQVIPEHIDIDIPTAVPKRKIG